MLKFIINSLSADRKKAIGNLVWGSSSYAAVSGPFAKGYIEIGTYTVKVRQVSVNPPAPEPYTVTYPDGTSVCFFIPLDPNFHTERDGIGIHPDGNVPGTEGCIGLQSSSVREFWNRWNNTPMADRPTTLEVTSSAPLTS